MDFCVEIPSELIIYIFSFLDVPKEVSNVALVSSYWRELVYHPKVWSVVDLTFCKKYLTCEKLRKLVTMYGRKMKCLSLSSWESFLYEKTSCHWGLLPLLQSIDLSNSLVSDHDLISIVSTCPEIRNLNLASTKKIRDQGILAIGFYCKNLTQLNLSECGTSPDDWRTRRPCAKITVTALERLMCGCGSTLKSLDLTNQQHTNDVVINAIAEHATGLVSLNLDLRLFTTKSSELPVTPLAFSQLLISCPLKHLKIGHFGFNLLPHILEHCVNLESFSDVSQTHYHTSDMYVSLVSTCTKLRHLQLPGSLVNDRVLEAIGKNLSVLTWLSINFMTATPIGIKWLTNCTNLRHLEIDTQLGDDCKNNESLVALCSGCTHLEYLALGKAHIDKQGLEALSTLSNLKYLFLTLMSPADKPALINLAIHCKNLQELHIPWTAGIDDDTICAFATHCPDLRVVVWRNRSLGTRGEDSVITGKSLTALGNNCRNLQKLEVYGGNDIGDSLAALAQGCHFLTEIKLGQCKGVGDAGLNKLIRHCPFLERVDLEGSSITRATMATLKRLGMQK